MTADEPFATVSHRKEQVLHIPFITRPEQNQNCAGSKRAERHETRRDVVSGQTEGNSVRVAEDVHRVEGLSHKNRASSSVG